MLEILVALALYGAFAAEYPSTFQYVPYANVLLRTDTRTGDVAVCIVSGTVDGLTLTCQPVKRVERPVGM